MKRSITVALCLIIIVSLFSAPAKATTQSSDFLGSYYSSVYAGGSSGQLCFTFSAGGESSMSSIGISKIDVYSSDGSYEKTIYGSISNGLLASSVRNHRGTYSFNATPGQRCYLDITFIAKDSYGGDSKLYTTNTAMAAR